MRKILLSLTVLAGVAGVSAAADAAPRRAPDAAPLVQNVDWHRGGYGERGYYRDWRRAEWRRHEAYEHWRRHKEWRRWRHAREW